MSPEQGTDFLKSPSLVWDSTGVSVSYLDSKVPTTELLFIEGYQIIVAEEGYE